MLSATAGKRAIRERRLTLGPLLDFWCHKPIAGLISSGCSASRWTRSPYAPFLVWGPQKRPRSVTA